MRLLLLAALLAAAPAHAGVWTRTAPDAMRFEGAIEEGEYDRFAAVFGPQVRELTVTSPGGITSEGIRIGLALAATSVKVIVAGECLSSCANYLFVAGHQREIRRGVVAYHGNVKACFGRPDPAREAAEDEDFARWMREQGVSEEDIRRNVENSRRRNNERLARQIADEARLLGLMGVSQELFDRSCTASKGSADGRSYDWYAPTRSSFERYGLWGIVGEQDPAVIAASRSSYLLD